MSIKDTLNQSLKEAMRENNDLRRRCLRMALANIKQSEIDTRSELDDTAVISVLHKEIKSRKESISDAEKAGRLDLINTAAEEIKILEAFLPQSLSEDALRDLVSSVITEIESSGPANLGKVIKLSMAKAQGRASGDVISRIAKDLLLPKA